jgi:hypothetical protein
MAYTDDWPPCIPIAYPVSVFDQKKNGRTQPVGIRCAMEDGSFDDYVVKLWANPEVHLKQNSLARELYGSLLAQWLGLDTPNAALVLVEPDFYQAIPYPELAQLFQASIGYNFGSKYVNLPIASSSVTPSRHTQAVKVFCFDMLICNSDRRIEKPNAFETSQGFMVFDHEQGFPFSRPQTFIGGFPPVWTYIQETWHKNHIFYKSIKNRNCALEIEEFITSVGCLSDPILDTIEKQIPEQWLINKDIQNIRHYLANTRDNADKFKRSLQEILA